MEVAKEAPNARLALETELNQLVYQAYGLDADDIAVIEGIYQQSAEKRKMSKI